MDANTALRSGLRSALAGLLAAFSMAIVSGCNEKHANAQGQADAGLPANAARALEATPAAVAQPHAVPAGQPSYKEEAFHLVLSAPPSVKVGEAAEFLLVLEAQSGFKVNDEYPIKFQFADTPGVVPKTPKVGKEAAKLEKQRATMPLSVTIKAAGKHQVSGTLSFSVCTDERCLIEKRELTLDVTAS